MNLITRLGLILLAFSQALSQTTPTANSYLKEAEVSEAEGTVHIVANSPRPMAQTLDALHKKYGWVVEYEDPQFTAKQDLVELPDPKTHAPNAQLFPAGGRFTVDFPAPSLPTSTQPPSSQPDAAPQHAPLQSAGDEKTLRLVVDGYNRSENPGRFELRKNNQGNLYVVGIAARDAKGQIAPQKPILDAPLTLARHERSATAMVEAICRRISVLRGTKVSLGVFPRNLLDHTPVTIGATKTSARDLLFQTLAMIHGSFYWRLLFDPGSKGYFLDIHSIQPAKNPA